MADLGYDFSNLVSLQVELFLTLDFMDPTRSLVSDVRVLLMDLAMAPSSRGSPTAVPVPCAKVSYGRLC
jgi:hypothetical protein